MRQAYHFLFLLLFPLLAFSSACEIRDENGQTLLHRAIISKDLELIQEVVNHPKVPVNAEDCVGKTPLALAAEMNLVDVVKVLLKHPRIRVNSIGSEAAIPIVLAAETGNTDLLRIFLEDSRFDVNAKGDHWYSKSALEHAVNCDNKEAVELLLAHEDIETNDALKFAIKNRNVEMFQLLLEHPKTDFKKELLHLAAKAGSLEIVKLILKMSNQVDINALDEDQKSPLHHAAENGHEEVVRFLLSLKGAEINLESGDGMTPLVLSAKEGSLATTKLLLEDPRIDLELGNPLHAAAENWRDQIVEMLLKDGRVPIDAEDPYERTPLCRAMEKHFYYGYSPKSVAILLRYGADVNRRAPLIGAAGGDLELLNLFLQHEKINVNIQDSWGYTALHVAAQSGKKENVKRLLDLKEIDLNLLTDGGFHVLNFASSTEIAKMLLEDPRIDTSRAVHSRNIVENTEILDLLLNDERFDINQIDKEGDTLLHSAIRNSNNHWDTSTIESIKLLLKAPRLDPNIQDSDGKTALHLACAKKDTRVVEMLLEDPRVDSDIRDNEGDLPIFIEIYKKSMTERFPFSFVGVPFFPSSYVHCLARGIPPIEVWNSTKTTFFPVKKEKNYSYLGKSDNGVYLLKVESTLVLAVFEEDTHVNEDGSTKRILIKSIGNIPLEESDEVQVECCRVFISRKPQEEPFVINLDFIQSAVGEGLAGKLLTDGSNRCSF